MLAVAVVDGALVDVCGGGESSGTSWSAGTTESISKPTETRASVPVEALVALAEVRAHDVAAAGVGVAAVDA